VVWFHASKHTTSLITVRAAHWYWKDRDRHSRVSGRWLLRAGGSNRCQCPVAPRGGDRRWAGAGAARRWSGPAPVLTNLFWG
jgi:hypothetical protein